MSSPLVPALDVGGTHISGALVDPATWTVVPGTWRSLPLDSAGSADAVLSTFATCAYELIATGLPLSDRLAVAMPGPFDYARGIGLFEGVAKFEALYGIEVGRELVERIAGVESVRFVNDAIAWVLGEWLSGAAAGCSRVLGLTLGTGVGSGFLVDGVPRESGPEVPPEGAVYRLTIEDRPLEDTVSRRAICTQFADRSGESLDVEAICSRARAGDAIAFQVLTEAFTALGAAVAPWIDRFRPEVVVVGGSISHSWDVVEPSLRQGLGPQHAALLRQSRLFDDAAMIGAAHHAG